MTEQTSCRKAAFERAVGGAMLLGCCVGAGVEAIMPEPYSAIAPLIFFVCGWLVLRGFDRKDLLT